MSSRRRVRTHTPDLTIVEGSGTGTPIAGHVEWGADFGDTTAGIGKTHDVDVSTDLEELKIQANQDVVVATQISEMGIAGEQSLTVDQFGTVLGAPFWNRVETDTQETAATGILIALPPTLVDGDLLIAFIGLKALAGTPTMTYPSGWTLVRSDNQSSMTAHIIYRIVDGTEGTDIEFTGSSGLWSSEVHRVRGVDQTTPIDAHGGNTGAAASLVTDPVNASITTTVPNCLVFAHLMHDHLALSQSHTEPASHQEVTDFEQDSATKHASTTDIRVFAAAAATGTATHNCTETAATDYICQRVAIRAGELELT